MGGVALGSVDVTVALDAGVVKLTPQRVALLGVGLSTAGFPATPLPLPPLPSSALLTDLRTATGTVVATLEVHQGSWDLGPSTIGQLLRLARSGRASIGVSAPEAPVGRFPMARPRPV